MNQGHAVPGPDAGRGRPRAFILRGRTGSRLVALLLWATFSPWTLADEVHLRNGKVLEAVSVERKGDLVILVLDSMTIQLPASEVVRVISTAPDPPRRPESAATPAGPSGVDSAAIASTVRQAARCTPPPQPVFGQPWAFRDGSELTERFDRSGDERYLRIREYQDSGDLRRIGPLIEWSEDPEPAVREAALRALGHFDDRTSLARLLKIVDLEEAGRREAAREGILRWCARRREAKVPPDLQAVLRELDPLLSSRLLAIAAGFDHEWARPALYYGLEWGRAESRREAIKALRAAGDPGVRRRLPVLLVDAEWSVRREAALLSGEIGAGEAAGRLVDLMRDPEPKVREAAHLALRNLTGLDLPAEEGPWRRWWREVRGE